MVALESFSHSPAGNTDLAQGDHAICGHSTRSQWREGWRKGWGRRERGTTDRVGAVGDESRCECESLWRSRTLLRDWGMFWRYLRRRWESGGNKSHKIVTTFPVNVKLSVGSNVARLRWGLRAAGERWLWEVPFTGRASRKQQDGFSAEGGVLLGLAACTWFYVDAAPGAFLLPYPHFSDCQYSVETVWERGVLSCAGAASGCRWDSRMEASALLKSTLCGVWVNEPWLGVDWESMWRNEGHKGSTREVEKGSGMGAVRVWDMAWCFADMWKNDYVWHSYGPTGSCGAETEVLSSVEKLRDQGIKWIVKRGIGALRRMPGA